MFGGKAEGLWMIAQRLLSAISLPAIFGTVLLVAALLAILAYLVLRWWRRPAPPPRPAVPLQQQPAAQPTYPVDSTQPTRAVSLPPGMYLVDSTGQQFTLDRLPAVIGRSPQSDLVVNAPMISYSHARIYSDRRLG